MNKINWIFALIIMTSVLFTSCSDDDDTSGLANDTFTLNTTGLEDLGNDFAYEGWLIVDGSPVTTGTFSVDASGVPSQNSFEVDANDLATATAFVLTIEPSPDSDPSPTDVHILGGDLSNGIGNLSVGHATALGDDFTGSTGGYILATPTDGGMDTDENSGVWWLDPAAGPGPGLSLPTLPAGWIYEGWAVVDGIPISTGRFAATSGADDFSGFSGSAGGPPFPGEDLLSNAPSGLDFPIDLAGKTVVISVEPVPDNSPAPFTLKPLVGPVPADADDHTFYEMNNNASATNPSGSIQ